MELMLSGLPKISWAPDSGEQYGGLDPGEAAVFSDSLHRELDRLVVNEYAEPPARLKLQLPRRPLVDVCLTGGQAFQGDGPARHRLHAAKARKMGGIDADEISPPLAQVLVRVERGDVLRKLWHQAVDAVVTGQIGA